MSTKVTEWDHWKKFTGTALDKMHMLLSDKELKANDPIIYNDTDSSYASIELLIKHLGLTFKNEKGEVHDDIYKMEIELVKYLNDEIITWGKKTFNSKD